ncbi:MAG TPA: hypothetical protein HA349_07100 [Methanotrichaceae archaeon]|nr:hypothetical protein [Methanotrichaceae archaeon]
MAFVLLGVIALFALAVSPALGDDSVASVSEDLGESASGSIVLDVYLDEVGRALLVGYLETESAEALAFLENSEYVHDVVTGELYALSGGLTSIPGDETRLEFEAEAEWDEFHLTFYLPADAKLLSVSCSEGLEYSVAEVEDSLAVEVLGYEVEGVEVAIDYNLAG